MGASGVGLRLLDGSLDGLDRFEQGGGVASGLHIPGDEPRSWNVQAVADRFANAPVALIEFAWRDRGLIVQPGRDSEFPDIASHAGRRVVPRQSAAGNQVLLEQLLRANNKGQLDVEWGELARTESEAALAVLEGKADAALDLRAVAAHSSAASYPSYESVSTSWWIAQPGSSRRCRRCSSSFAQAHFSTRHAGCRVTTSAGSAGCTSMAADRGGFPRARSASHQSSCLAPRCSNDATVGGTPR